MKNATKTNLAPSEMPERALPERERNSWLRLTEIFYSIQGESSHAGRPCVFVRLSRCNLRCTWCDTTYSFKGGEKTEIDEILSRVEAYGCRLVEITGGEPLLQPAVHDLMRTLCDQGYTVLIETSGSLDISTIDARVVVIMDLKAPGSGEVSRNRLENIDHLKAGDELKFVILDRGDYDWSVEMLKRFDLTKRASVIFSPVHGKLDAQLLGQWILDDKLDVRLGLQLHKFLEME